MSSLFDHEDGTIYSVNKFHKAHADDKWRRHYEFALRLRNLADDIEMYHEEEMEHMPTHMQFYYTSIVNDLNRMLSMMHSIMLDREKELGIVCIIRGHRRR